MRRTFIADTLKVGRIIGERARALAPPPRSSDTTLNKIGPLSTGTVGHPRLGHGFFPPYYLLLLDGAGFSFDAMSDPITLPSGEPPPSPFEPTRWSLVARARGADERERRRALEALCTAYWYPLYAFLRRLGRTEPDAEDLVQDFFTRLLSSGGALESADPARGKFRTLLLTMLRHLDTDAHRAAGRLKRGGGTESIPLDCALAEVQWQVDSSLAGSPEAAFDRAWAAAVMRRAGERLRAEHAEPEQAALFAELAPRLTGGAGDGGLAAVAARLGRSEAAVKMALSRLRRRYAEAIRAEVAETVGSREEIEGELRYLLSAIA